MRLIITLCVLVAAQSTAAALGELELLRELSDATEEQEAAALEMGDLFEGDIRATYEQVVAMYGQRLADELLAQGRVEAPRGLDNDTHNPGRRQLAIYTYRRWELRDEEGRVVVPWEPAPDSNFDSGDVNTIEEALEGIMATVPAVRFVRRDSSHSTWINVLSDATGCWSYVGNVFAGAQPLNLQNPGCVYTGTVQHEFMHALGVFHEQSRPDRDNFVTIELDNIIAGYQSNFEQVMFAENLGVEYDLRSVMHYTPNSFGKRRVSCVAEQEQCGLAAAVVFVGRNEATPHCISSDGTLRPCDDPDFAEAFHLHNVGHSVELRSSVDSSQCLLPASTSGSLYAGGLTRHPCAGDHWDRFQLHGDDLLGTLRLKWEGHRSYCLTRDLSSAQDTVAGTLLKVGLCDNSANQDFQLTFLPASSLPCEEYQLCSDASGTYTTITPLAGSISRSSISASDALQLQLLYQCEDGSRTVDTMCSASCPCYAGFACSTSEQCRAGLTCGEAGVCEEAEQATMAPSAAPTVMAPCETYRRADCPNDRCEWTLVTETAKACVPRSCGKIKTRVFCDPERCEWGQVAGEEVCFPKDSGSGQQVVCGRRRFARARRSCAEAGQLLCTVEQLEAQFGEDPCSTRRKWVWTQESCGPDMQVVFKLKGRQTKCQSTTERAQVRCCPSLA